MYVLGEEDGEIPLWGRSRYTYSAHFMVGEERTKRSIFRYKDEYLPK